MDKATTPFGLSSEAAQAPITTRRLLLRLPGRDDIPALSRLVSDPVIAGFTAQIRYPYGASVEDARNKLEFDLYYVKNGSLFLDVGIIFHTVRHVLLGRGAR